MIGVCVEMVSTPKICNWLLNLRKGNIRENGDETVDLGTASDKLQTTTG